MVADITLPIEIDEELVTVKLDVTFEFAPGSPAHVGGSPDSWAPAEPPEVRVSNVEVLTFSTRCDDESGPCAADVDRKVARSVREGWPELERKLIEAAEAMTAEPFDND